MTLETDEVEEITGMLESGRWEMTVDRLFREQLDTWKRALLTSANLDERTRLGYLYAREAILKGFKELYRKYNVELPSWLEE